MVNLRLAKPCVPSTSRLGAGIESDVFVALVVAVRIGSDDVLAHSRAQMSLRMRKEQTRET